MIPKWPQHDHICVQKSVNHFDNFDIQFDMKEQEYKYCDEYNSNNKIPDLGFNVSL